MIKYFFNTENIHTILKDIPAGKSIDIEWLWNANIAGINQNISVVVDPENMFPEELLETNNKAVTSLTVNATTKANLSISHEMININPSPINEGGNASIAATIMNNGFSDATDFNVEFYLGAPGLDGMLLNSINVQSLSASESETYIYEWQNISFSGNNIITVRIEPKGNEEISLEDNSDFIKIIVDSLPDISISDSSIYITPPVAKQGGQVNITVSVFNHGGQDVSDVNIIVKDSGVVISPENFTLASLPAGSHDEISFSYNVGDQQGVRAISVEIDSDNEITESNEFNNSATKTISVQDSSQWISEKYISPNGDGIQDYTEAFVKFPEKQIIKVVIENNKSEVVRHYQSSEYDNVDALSILWDGLNDEGIVSADGDYKIVFSDEVGNVLVMLSVTVDNNSSPLTLAVGTDYLLINKLNESIGNINKWQWFPDESGMIMYKSDSGASDVYGPGVYSVAPDGTGIKLLTPEKWGDREDSSYYYRIRAVSFFKDSNAVIRIEKTDKNNYSKFSEIWSVDKYGEKIEKLYTIEVKDNHFGELYLAPDGLHIACVNYENGKVIVFNTKNQKIFKVEPIFLQDERLKMYGTQYGDKIIWASDSSKFYIIYEFDIQGEWNDKTKIFCYSMSGQISDVAVIDNKTHYVKRFDDNQLIIASGDWGNKDYQLVDATNNGQVVTIGSLNEYWGDIPQVVVSSDNSKLAFITINENIWEIKIYDNGQIYSVYESPYMNNYFTTLSDLQWSKNDKELFFVDHAYEKVGECAHNVYQVTLDLKTLEKKAVRIAGPEDSCYEPHSYHIYILNAGIWVERVVLHYGKGFETQEFDLSNWFSDANTTKRLKIVHEGTDGANIDFISLNSPTMAYQPAKAVSGLNDILSKIVEQDGNYANACKKEIEMTWENIPAGSQTLVLRMNANEYNYGSFVSGSMNWFDDETSMIGLDSIGLWTIDFESGEKFYLMPEIERDTIVTISPYENYIVASGYGMWSITSLLNLKANLRASIKSDSIILKGIAADLNFDRYLLTYSPIDNPDINNPETWEPIIPPSDIPVVNDEFAVWVPPEKGTYYVQLTVYDKAGNISSDRQRIAITNRSSITGLYREGQYISPNNDGIQDSAELHYRAMEPVHLEFEVYDESQNLVRTYQESHNTAGTYFISWDGKDSNGYVVDDGVYSIKIFDFEFFYTIDNTMPDTSLSLDLGYDKLLYASLSGFAQDENIKSWTIEYGEGDNPEEWYEFKIGSGVLPKEDNKVIERFWKKDIDFLVGKRFRIIVQDYAGNSNTRLADLLKEYIFISRWGNHTVELNKNDANIFYADSLIPAYEVLPEQNSLDLFETVRRPLLSYTIQFKSSNNWQDSTEMMNPADGQAGLIWNSSGIDLEEISEVRIKAIDIAGEEYFFLLVIKEFFEFDPFENSYNVQQTHVGSNFLDFTSTEKLKWLKFQKQSVVDVNSPNEGDWEDYLIYDSENGDIIPSGVFPLPVVSIDDNSCYFVRMIGLGESGKNYQTESIAYPNGCKKNQGPNEMGAIAYKMANTCNDLSHEIDITVENREDLTPQKTSYYLEQEPGQFTLLESFNNTIGHVTINTQSMDAGEYVIKVEIEYAGFSKVIFNSIGVDKTLPHAEISYPKGMAEVCPRLVQVNGGDDWLKIDIEKIVLGQWKIFWGEGENPITWHFLSDSEQEANGEKIWNVTSFDSGVYSLLLKVWAPSGNLSCTQSSFVLKRPVNIESSCSTKLFSPNGDDLFDTVTLSYMISEYAFLTADAGYIIPDSGEFVQVTRILDRHVHYGGSGSVDWNGLNINSEIVPDGKYVIRIIAEDACGNTSVKISPEFEVDVTPPSTAISYPNQTSVLSVVSEITGTVSDKNFLNYSLKAFKEGSSDSVIEIDGVASPVIDKYLGRWNTYGLAGTWTLQLTAQDKVRNKSEFNVIIDLGERNDLIKDLNVSPRIFSPDNDGIFEKTAIEYVLNKDLNETYNVTINIKDQNDAQLRVISHSNVAGGNCADEWDGFDSDNVKVPDGLYNLMVIASLVSSPQVTHEESMTVVVDATAPFIKITPEDMTYYKGGVQISGTIQDEHLLEYTVGYSSTGGTIQIDSGTESRKDTMFKVLNDLEDGEYHLKVVAKDKGEISSAITNKFIVDKTPPALTLLKPEVDMFFGGTNDTMQVEGSVDEANLESWILRYGQELEPQDWVILVEGSELPVTQTLFSLNTGISDGIQDGTYTLSLLATDKAGWQTEKRVVFVVDNTKPVVDIDTIEEGGFLTSQQNIYGSATDQNFAEYVFELSDGDCATAYKWSPLAKSDIPVQSGMLANWPVLPADGSYCLKISANDKSGNTEELKVSFEIDTTPPAHPVLTGSVENNSKLLLSWSQVSDADLLGYNLYTEGELINNAPLETLEYRFPEMTEGSYSFIVKAVDHAGWESKESNRITLKVDKTPPVVRITKPADGSLINDLIDIKGTAFSIDDFKEYRVWSGMGDEPSSWALIRKSPASVSYGELARNNTILNHGQVWSIKLEAEDISGNTNIHQVSFTIDNQPPAAPVLNTPSSTGQNVNVFWQLNTEDDLAGYLLYRNGKLVNTNGLVINDITPYLLTGAAYKDNSLPDGAFSYYLEAVDKAGNISPQSNSVEITIDTRAPGAVISSPVNNYLFETPVWVKAQTEDLDINSVLFQYKKADTYTWLAFASVNNSNEYSAYLDPEVSGLVYGQYHLRVTATDISGNTGTPSSVITVEYKDLTAPSKPLELKSTVNGSEIILTWLANLAADQATGYNVYRKVSDNQYVQLNGELVNDTGFIVLAEGEDFSDGEYRIVITAVDSNRNESTYSDQITALVYKPVLEPATSPVIASDLCITGKDAALNSKVTVFVNAVSGEETQVTVQSDEKGFFTACLTLTDGKNTISASATDPSGNVSKRSDTILVVYGQKPEAPENLTATSDGTTIMLDWSHPDETNIAGYSVFRNSDKGWMKINSSLISESQWANTGLTNGEYTYKLTCTNNIGLESEFSDEVSSVVLVAVPEAPYNLSVVETPTEGGKIKLCWEYSGTGSGFDLYRSIEQGSGYQRVDGDSVSEMCFLDENLTNGVTYYYVVVAVDAVGNESAPSNEAFGVAEDTVLPEKPVILKPAIHGYPAVSSTDSTIIEGTAESLSMINLYKNAELIETVIAGEGAIRSEFILSRWSNGLSISPDGKSCAYSDDENNIIIRELTTGTEKLIYSGGSYPVWSPDGSRVAFSAVGFDDGVEQTIVYDFNTEKHNVLSGGESWFEGFHSWTKDNNKIAFVCAQERNNIIAIYDFSLSSYRTVTFDTYLEYSLISPDGSKIIYLDSEGSVLIIFDLETGQHTIVDTQVTGGSFKGQASAHSPKWTPDSLGIVYASNKNRANEIFKYNLEDEKIVCVTPGVDVDSFSLSPSGEKLVFGRTKIEETLSISVVSFIDISDVTIVEYTDFFYLDALYWATNGSLYYLNDTNLVKSGSDGKFEFRDIRLNSGDNIFYAVATDSAGNESLPSDDINVVFDKGLLPDLKVEEDDINIWPGSPIEGDEVTITIKVSNTGVKDAENVDVAVSLWGFEGNTELLKQKTIPLLKAEHFEFISLVIESTERTGENDILVEIDPDDRIMEADELNNFQEKDFYIADKEGITLSADLDSEHYGGGEELTIHVTAYNSGHDSEGFLAIRVIDTEGYLVDTIYSEGLLLSYGSSENITARWNTNDIVSGNYSVDVVFGSSDSILSNLSIPFAIDIAADAATEVFTNKLNYVANEDVQALIKITNNGALFNIPALDIYCSIKDQNENELFTNHSQLVNLLTGTPVSQNIIWNTCLNSPGVYTVNVDISSDGEMISEGNTEFTITPVTAFTGTIKSNVEVVATGGQVRFDYSINSHGNNAPGMMPVSVFVVDSETGEILSLKEENITIGLNETIEGFTKISTEGYKLKTYNVVLRYDEEGEYYNLASTLFKVSDLHAPVITVRSPVAGNSYAGEVEFDLGVTDTASGIKRVEYRIDGKTWAAMVNIDSATGRWFSRWDATDAAGTHTVEFRAVDFSGNEAFTELISINIEQPYIEISGMISVSPGEVSAGDSVKIEYTIANNGNTTAKQIPVKVSVIRQGGSEPIIVEEKESTIEAKTSDSYLNYLQTLTFELGSYFAKLEYMNPEAGEYTELASAIFNVKDSIPPELTILAPLPNTIYDAAFELAVTATDVLTGVDHVEYSIDNGPWAELPISDLTSDSYSIIWEPQESDEGIIIINFRASDTAGNISEPVSVSVVIELTTPFEKLTGSLSAIPTAPYRWRSVDFAYLIKNETEKDAGEITVRVVITGASTGDTLETFERVETISASGIIAGAFGLEPVKFPVSTYKATLTVINNAIETRELSTASFTVQTSVEVEPVESDITNLLVWVNDNCQAVRDGDGNAEGLHCIFEDCVRVDLIEQIMDAATNNYHIVYDKEDFEREIRNPFYTDIFVFGTTSLSGLTAIEEIVEKINGGTGMASSLWLQQGINIGGCFELSSVFGAVWHGIALSAQHTIETVAGSVTEDDLFDSRGLAYIVKPDKTTEIAGWIKGDKWPFSDYPAIILNTFGSGKTVYFTFDLGLALDDNNYDSLSKIITRSIKYIHTNKSINRNYPARIVPVEMKFESKNGDFSAKSLKTFSPPLRMYDTATGELTSESPQSFGINITNENPGDFVAYFLVPDIAGTWPVFSETGIILDESFIPVESFTRNIEVDIDRDVFVSEIMADIKSLNVSFWYLIQKTIAVKIFKNLKTREVNSQEDLNKNIKDIIGTIHTLQLIKKTDVSVVRTKLDNLLEIEESRYYFYHE